MSKGDSGGGAAVGGGSATATGATGAGGAIGPSGRSADGKHDVHLPADKKRLTIDQADAALKQMGGRIDKGSAKSDLNTKQTTYSVKLPNGSTQRLTAKELAKIVYAGKR